MQCLPGKEGRWRLIRDISFLEGISSFIDSSVLLSVSLLSVSLLVSSAILAVVLLFIEMVFIDCGEETCISSSLLLLLVALLELKAWPFLVLLSLRYR